MRPSSREWTGSLFMLRCAQLHLSHADLDEMTIGMVQDMIIESGNDREKYDLQGEPGTLRDFLTGGGRIGK